MIIGVALRVLHIDVRDVAGELRSSRFSQSRTAKRGWGSSGDGVGVGGGAGRVRDRSHMFTSRRKLSPGLKRDCGPRRGFRSEMKASFSGWVEQLRKWHAVSPSAGSDPACVAFCRTTDGAVRFSACIDDPVAIEKLLTHLDLKHVSAGAARRPPNSAPPRDRGSVAMPDFTSARPAAGGWQRVEPLPGGAMARRVPASPNRLEPGASPDPRGAFRGESPPRRGSTSGG